MRHKTIERIKRYLPFFAAFLIATLLCASTPVSQALWSTVLKATGTANTGSWDTGTGTSSLQVDAQGVHCEPEVLLWAQVTNVGPVEMRGDTPAVVWYSAADAATGAEVSGSAFIMPPLPAGTSQEITVPPARDADGNVIDGHYWLLIDQGPDDPSETGVVWSGQIDLLADTCQTSPPPP